MSSGHPHYAHQHRLDAHVHLPPSPTQSKPELRRARASHHAPLAVPAAPVSPSHFGSRHFVFPRISLKTPQSILGPMQGSSPRLLLLRFRPNNAPISTKPLLLSHNSIPLSVSIPSTLSSFPNPQLDIPLTRTLRHDRHAALARSHATGSPPTPSAFTNHWDESPSPCRSSCMCPLTLSLPPTLSPLSSPTAGHHAPSPAYHRPPPAAPPPPTGVTSLAQFHFLPQWLPPPSPSPASSATLVASPSPLFYYPASFSLFFLCVGTIE